MSRAAGPITTGFCPPFNPPSMLRSPLLLVGVLALALAGCDETGGVTGGSVAQQIDHARAARQNGDYETAVRILDAAYAANPSNAALRAEYGVTLLERDDLDLLDLDRVASFLADAGGALPAAPAPSPTLSVGAGSCPYATQPGAVPFDPTGYDGFPDLQANAAVIDQTLALLDPVIPDAIQSFQICTSITNGPDGPTLNYVPAEALAEMRASGMTDDQIAAALAANGLARFLKAYLTVTTTLSQQTTWYRLDGGSRLGVCADDPDLLQTEAETAIEDLGEAVFSLDLRGSVLGDPALTQDLVDLMLEGYAEIRDGLGTYCSANG